MPPPRLEPLRKTTESKQHGASAPAVVVEYFKTVGKFARLPVATSAANGL